MNEHELEQALRALRDEEPEQGLAAEVRAGTLARIQRQRRGPWMWAGLSAAAVALMVVGLSVVRRPAEVKVPPRPVEVAAQKPAAAAPKVEVAKAVMRPKTRRMAPPRRPELAKEPMRIQMLTDDPDVLIIWLVGEEEEGALE